jgi:hypothetical protein
MPKPTALAIQEMLEGKLYFRRAEEGQDQSGQQG